MRALHRLQTEWALIGFALFAGCGEAVDPKLSTVSGNVTLDGKPLDDAQIEFSPQHGSPSYGTTDQQGAYTLRFTRDRQGATPGSHIVRIRTYRDEDKTGQRRAERLPVQYNTNSELRREVVDGENKFDFNLSSKGKVVQPDRGR